MVIENTKIAVRYTWMSWLRGVISALGTFSLMIFGIFAAFTLELYSRGGGSLAIPVRLEILFALWLIPSLARHLLRAPYSAPVFLQTSRVEAADGAINLDSKARSVRLTRSQVVDGWTISDEGPIAVLQTKGRTIFVRAPDESAAQAILEQAGVGAGGRALSMRLERSPKLAGWRRLAGRLLETGSYAHRAGSVALMALIAFAAHSLLGYGLFLSTALAPWVMIALGTLLATANLLTTRVRVGTDGIAITRLGRREFVSASEIKSVWRAGDVVHVELRDGDPLVFAGPSAVATGVLLRRIQAIVDSGERTQQAEDGIRALERDGRTAREWLHAVRRATEASGNYRHGWLDGHDLVALAADGRADAEQRIAAAAALSACADEEARRRLRIELDACADEPVRVAIEKALDGELEAVEIERIVTAEGAS